MQFLEDGVQTVVFLINIFTAVNGTQFLFLFEASKNCK